jgi:hypothetical protein
MQWIDIMNQHFEYDVVFSFAGEQRDYVEKTKNALLKRGIRVFYDRDETPELWGKDLYQHLSEIYRKKARYCVVFLSRDYADKLWTKHELKIIQARAFQESREYILPARFDDTEIPGLLPTIGYVDLRQLGPEDLADLLAKKIGAGTPIDAARSRAVDPALEGYLAEAVFQAEEYLRPDPGLIRSDRIAEVVRKSFRLAGVDPTADSILQYLRNDKPAFRVVGYLAFQISPLPQLVPDLINCLTRERRLASEAKETRPLWQLLVCFTALVRKGIDARSRDLIRDALDLFLDFLRSDSSIDTGGECKERIEWLIT